MRVTPIDFSNFKMALEATSFDPATAFPADDDDHASFFSGILANAQAKAKDKPKDKPKGKYQVNSYEDAL